jgi:capping protein alpha
MVSKIGQPQPGKFLDPNSGKLYEFDHMARKWLTDKATGSANDTSNAKLRSALEKALRKYVEEFYVDPKDYALAVYDQGDGNLVVLISAKRVNLGNFWSGGWRSTHTVNVAGSKGKVSAHINANVHYFEEGNVQLNTNFDEEFDVKVEDPESFSKEVSEVIKGVENKFQKNMEEMYLNMHTQTFKAMRRFLPVTGTKMDWNPNAHRMVDQLTKN